MKSKLNLWLIIAFSVCFRLVLSLKFNTETFIGTNVPMPLQPDAFYYYSMFSLPIQIIYLAPLVFFSIGLIFLFFLMKDLGIKHYDLYTLFVGIVHTVLLQTYAGYTDSNSFIFMCMLAILYSLSRFWNGNPKLTGAIFGFFATALYLNWGGGLGLLILILMTLLFLVLVKSKKYISLGIFSLVSLVPIIVFGGKLFEYSQRHVISELQGNLSVIYFFFMLLYMMLFFDNWKVWKLNLNLGTISLLSFFFMWLSLLQQRWTYLAIPLMTIMMAYWIQEYKFKKVRHIYSWLFIIYIIVSVGTSINFFSKVEPLVTMEEAEMFSTLENKPILGSWGYGHMYNYFTKNALYKGDISHDELTLRYELAIINNYSNFLGNYSGYVIISPKELKRYNTTFDLPLIYDGRYRVYEVVKNE
jgi:hypothetical protein